MRNCGMFLTFALTAPGVGCVTLFGGGGAPAERTYRQPMTVVNEALRDSFRDMEVRPEGGKLDRFGGELRARTAAGLPVVVKVEPDIGNVATKVTVRIAKDPAQAEALLEHLDKQVGAPGSAASVAPPPVPADPGRYGLGRP